MSGAAGQAADTPITIYLPTFNGGGAENALVRLANHWTAEGRDVSFLCNSERGRTRGRLDPRISVQAIGTERQLLALPGLTRALRRRRPALLVTALFGPNMTAPIVTRLVSPRTAVVALMRNHTSREFGARGRIARPLVTWLLRRVMRRVDMIGCVSEDVADDFVAFAHVPADRVMVTRNPVPFPVVDPAAPPPPDWPATGPVIVAVARLVPQKDYATLVRAFAGLDGAPHLVILGDGPLHDEIARLAGAEGAGGRVHLLGFRDQPERYVARADLFVLTSLYEGFPNVIAEALSLGRTVVATDAPGGSREILDGGRFGYLAPVGDVAAIRAAMRHALDHPVAPEVAQGRARQYELPQVAKNYERLFDAALRHRSPSR